MSTLLKSNLVVATGTALSRVSGLVRLIVLGAVLGDTALADAYVLANESPNIVYELLVGGVLSATLVPLFTSFDEKRDDEARNVVVTTATVLITLVTIVAVAAAPLIFGLFSIDVADDVDPGMFRNVGTTLARIFLIQILFYGLTGVANAFLNSRRRFFAAAWSPILPNLIIIASLLSLPSTPGPDGWPLEDVLSDTRLRLTLGFGATAGIAVMALTLLPAAYSAGLRPKFTWNLRHPAVKKLLTLSMWTVGFVAANVVALTVIRNLTEPGSSNAFAYLIGFTFFMLPHGLLGVSIATTFQPEMSRAVARGDKPAFIRSASLGIRMTALLTIPAGVGLFVLRQPLISLLFGNGEFGDEGVEAASRALAGFALGLGAFSVYLFVLRAFYAHQDTRTAFVVNVVENAMNIVLAFVLVGSYGVLGLGASFAIAYVVAGLWVLQILSYKVPGFSVAEVLASIWKMIVAAALMGESVWFVTRNVGGNDGIDAVVRLGVGTVVGVVVYGGLLLAMGAGELTALRQRFSRPQQSPAE
ncbi:MAG: murein biosynthesis integral membrane protein MurJ [Ilumatobacter sp.]|uniref:murein biosynthesis integral membrane protein MurJ n=1 Tax=Ilumatobacter sp. TaxID=1967498 RepID=UPI00391D70F8